MRHETRGWGALGRGMLALALAAGMLFAAGCMRGGDSSCSSCDGPPAEATCSCCGGTPHTMFTADAYQRIP